MYREAADAIVARRTGTPRARSRSTSRPWPTVVDGANGMKFIEAALESSRMGRSVSARLEL